MMEKEKNCGCAEQAAHTPDKRRHLMQQIAECEFICIDINLFLDMHPDDARALSDYNWEGQSSNTQNNETSQGILIYILADHQKSR